jgi:hypothetical protein
MISIGAWVKDKGNRIHRLRLVLKEAHGVLDQNFVLEADEFDDFFGDPRANDLQVYLAHVYLE